jgi:hypothetical protein
MAAGMATFASEQKVGFAANVDEIDYAPVPVHLRQRRDADQGYYPVTQMPGSLATGCAVAAGDFCRFT